MQVYASLSDADVTSVVRLLSDLIPSAAPLAEKRISLITGVARLIDADIWAWAGSRLSPEGALGPLYFHDGGYVSPAEQQALIHYSSQPLFWEAVMSQFSGKALRAVRFDFSHAHGASPEAFDLVREAAAVSGVGRLLFFTYPLDATTTSVIGIHRRSSKPDYADREVALVHLVFSQVDWLHRAGTDVPANTHAFDVLPPRTREVVIYLLTGRSRKEIARCMGISSHTVNDYCKDIYRRFEVTSNTELLSLFINAASR